MGRTKPGNDGAAEEGRIMRRLLILVLALALAWAGTAPASAITFGDEDGNLHPNVGVVVIDRSAGSPGPDITCSGTLIAEFVFLTVAHCVDVLESVGQPYYVSFESTYDEDAAAPAGLISGTAIQHPLWGSGRQDDTHDIAVVLLDSAPPGVVPAELPTAGLPISSTRAASFATARSPPSATVPCEPTRPAGRAPWRVVTACVVTRCRASSR
jgi:hypothetical protein